MLENKRLRTSNSALVIVDIQSRLAPAIAGIGDILDRNLLLIAAAKRLGVPIALTEQYSRGLGSTVEVIAAAAGGAPVFEKKHFDATAEHNGLADHCAGLGRTQLLVTGCEAHVCVMQTILGLMECGHEVFLIADAVGSRHEMDKALALDRMKAAGASLVTTEMVIFEWLRTADNPAFRELLPGIRDLSLGK